MKVWVDLYKCKGHAACCDEAPEIFVWDDELNQAYAVEGDVPAGLEANAKSGARVCPEKAIVVTE